MTKDKFFQIFNEDLKSKALKWKQKLAMKEKEFVKHGWKCTVF
jgi:hypothetical protein